MKKLIPFDLCVINTADGRQAQFFRKQIEQRKRKGYLAYKTTAFASPSGWYGATVDVFKSIRHKLRGNRILVIHSGGQSKRLPLFSTVGKVFIPLPPRFRRPGQTAIFDFLLDKLGELPSLSEGQVIVACGDVLFDFDASQVVFSKTGVTGLAYAGPLEVACNHDVYMVSEDGEVIDFLEKPTEAQLMGKRFLIDIGVMNFALDAAEDVAGARRFKDLALSVCPLKDCQFFHMGTTGELLENFYAPRAYTAKRNKVSVSAAVRLDFAGGWSDLVPYWIERGGAILNAAVKLNGKHPIRVTVQGNHSVDSTVAEKREFPIGQAPLLEAACLASGIDRDSGVDLSISTDPPEGTGLGVSSILGAAIIAGLGKISGIEMSVAELANRALYMEQIMCIGEKFGGGLQDQIGGITPGVKLIDLRPCSLSPTITTCDSKYVSDVFDDCLLYYTGYTRSAGLILNSITRKYVDGDQDVIRLIAADQVLAYKAYEALYRGDTAAFGLIISQVWELYKQLDPGISNEAIESILGKISDYAHGAKLIGAGGGGFLFIVAADSDMARQVLEDQPPNSRARFFDFHVDSEGICIRSD